MNRRASEIHYASSIAEDKGLESVLFWSVFAEEVERLFKFQRDEEMLHWIVRVADNGSWTAKVSLINRSDLQSHTAKKFNMIIPQACCPEIVSLKKCRCGFVHDKQLTIKKFAPLVIKELEKTRS